MHRLFSAGILALGLVLGASVQAAPTVTQAEMNQGLDIIQTIFEVEYAPKVWKNSFASWSLQQEIQTAKASVNSRSQMSLRDYQKVLKRFFNSTKDYHVGVSFLSTEKASLPLDIRGADGRYFISFIDRTKLSEATFPFAVGDEIIRFDGRAVEDVINELKVSIGENTAGTDQGMAELMLTRRAARNTLTVPKGPVSIEILPMMSLQKTYVQQLIWDYQPEKIGFNKSFPAPDILTPKEKLHKFVNKTMASSLSKQFAAMVADQPENPLMIGAKKSYIPALGTKIWSAPDDFSFHAYIFKSAEGKLIGYVRIPSYVAGEEESKAFAAVMTKFAQTTDGLVIDQINNPGGSVFYLYSLVAMLTDQSYATPKHRMALNQAEVYDALDTLKTLAPITNDEEAVKVAGETIGGYPVSYQVVQFVRTFAQFMIDEWNAGKRITDPHFLYIDHINPHPAVNYTKPVLLLTNYMDFSGGDFFPAILQDNKRVTILGTRTAGAGGYVHSVKFPNILGIEAFSVTASIAERVSLDPIENLGVTPDIEYNLTANDLQGGYQDYVKAILAAVKDIVK